MSLSCSCEYDYDGEGWGWNTIKEIKMPVGVRKRCCSCKTLIQICSPALEFNRFRDAITDVECKIYGDNYIDLAPWYLCEICSDLYWSLDELGYCVELGDNMHELVAEYAQLQSSLKQENIT